MPEELWEKVCNIVQEVVNKTIPKKKKSKEAKWLSEEALQIAEERREAKSKEEREWYHQLNTEFQTTRRVKAASADGAQRTREVGVFTPGSRVPYFSEYPH